jgi:Ca2+-binding RTX toxin-like protein
VDLSRHRADYDVHLQDRPDVMLSGFERVEAGGRRVSVTGDSKDNVLTSQACSSNLRGGSGEDLRDASEQPYGVCESWLTAALVGGPGDDALIGSPGDDSLDGRSGDDVVRGRGGVDTCRGEDIIGCEIG